MMAQLLDSVASSSASSPPSSQTPPHSGAARWSPGKAGGTAEVRLEQPRHHRHPSQHHQKQQQQQPLRTSRDNEYVSARRTRKARNVDESDSPELLSTSPIADQQQQRPQPAAYRCREEGDAATPNSTIAEDLSSFLEASSLFSRDDARPTGGHSSNWASPAEVLQLRAMFREVTAGYQREQTRLREELAKAQAECAAYASERARVRQLQQTYTEGLAQCEKAKKLEAEWAEEKALQQLQLEKIMIENQRLQLFIAKKQKLHGSAHGSGTAFASTESKERIQAAVQGVTAATESRVRGGAYTPSIPVTGVTMVPASRLETASPLSSTPSNQLGKLPFCLTSEEEETGATAAGRAARSRGGEMQGRPCTFLSSEFPAGPASSPPRLTPPSQQQPQQLGSGTMDSGSLAGADRTQLPGPTNAEMTGVSPSTDASASSYLSLSPTPLHRPPKQQQQQHATHHATEKHHSGSAEEMRREEKEEEEQRRSSFLVTPSPTVSAAATTPSSSASLSQSAGAGRRVEGAGQRNRDATIAGVDHGARPCHPLTHNSEEVEEDEEETEEEESNMHDNDDRTGGGTSAEFDPSYARGVTDISSSSGSHHSNLSASAAAAMAVRCLIDARAPLQAEQQRQQRPPTLPSQEEMPSSPLATSGSLGGGGLLASTTQTDQTQRTATVEGAAATTARTSVATAATATATTTTATTPSFLASTGATPATGFSTTSSTWSLQYLYHLPRTPAEALQEELRMMKELRRLSEENDVLEARLQHLTAVKAMDTDQREQQVVQLTQAQEQARRRAAQWELTATQLQSEVEALQARWAEARDALAEALATSKRQQLQAQARLAEAETGSRAALLATREETLTRLAVLQRTWREVAHEQAQARQRNNASCSPHSAGKSMEGEESLQNTIEALRADLHAAHAAHVELEDRHYAAETDAAARLTHLENMLVRAHDELDRVMSEKNNAVLSVDQLEAEVERLRGAAATQEACMHAMEERLRLATGELATQADQLTDASTWQARALGAEEELATQRAFYEREINVYKTAACNIQERHHREMEKAVRRYKKLVVRFEAMKLRLCVTLTDGAREGFLDDGMNTADTSSNAPQRSQTGTTTSPPANTLANSPNPAAGKGRSPQRGEGVSTDEKAESLIVSGNAASPQGSAKMACDTVRALRTSVEATNRIVQSLNRDASSSAR